MGNGISTPINKNNPFAKTYRHSIIHINDIYDTAYNLPRATKENKTLHQKALEEFAMLQDYYCLLRSDIAHKLTIEDYKNRSISFLYDIDKFKHRLASKNINMTYLFFPRSHKGDVLKDINSQERFSTVYSLPISDLLYNGIQIFFYEDKKAIVDIMKKILPQNKDVKVGIVYIKGVTQRVTQEENSF